MALCSVDLYAAGNGGYYLDPYVSPFSVTATGALRVSGSDRSTYTVQNPTDSSTMNFSCYYNDWYVATQNLTITIQPTGAYDFTGYFLNATFGNHESVQSTTNTLIIPASYLNDWGSAGLSIRLYVSGITPITYTITYLPNGGSGSPQYATKGYGEAYTISSYAPTYPGHVLAGWSTDPNATAPQYVAGDVYRGNANLTLYAVWDLETYLVTFDANGGESAPSPQAKQFDVPMQITSLIPIWENHTFVNWNTAADGTGTTYYPEGTYLDNAPITLYAQWDSGGGGNTYVYFAHVWQQGRWIV